MSTKQELINAARDLLWEVGYEAMSPALILERSGAGKGSLYHHFDSKEDLALASIIQVQSDLNTSAEKILNRKGSPIGRIKKFLLLERQALMGCRLGRLVNEHAVINSCLLEPITAYFTKTQYSLEKVLLDAIEKKELQANCDAKALSMLILAVIQGGFVLSKANQDKTMLASVTSTLHTIINSKLKPSH